MLEGERFELFENIDKEEFDYPYDSEEEFDFASVPTDEFLKNEFVLEHINSIDVDKLEIIIHNDNKLHGNDIKRLFSNPNVVNNINSLDTEKLKLIFEINKHLLCMILTRKNAIKGLISIDFERLSILLKNINKIGKDDNKQIERFLSINDDYLYYCMVIQSMFENPKLIDVITSMNIEVLKSVPKPENIIDEIMFELLKGKKSNYIEKLKLVFNHPKHRCESMMLLIEDMNAFDMIDLISIDKLRVILTIIGLPLTDIMEKNNKGILKLFESFEIEKLKFLIEFNNDGAYYDDEEDEKLIFKMLKKLPKKITWRKATKSLNTQGLKFLVKFRNANVIERGDVIRMNLFNFIDDEKLWYVVMFDRKWKLLKNKNIRKSIDLLNIEKLKLLLKNCDSYGNLCSILKNKEAMNFIVSLEIEKLKKMINVMNDWETFMAEFEGKIEVKKNLNFALALHETGTMEKFDYQFVKDKKAVNEAITDVFPRDSIINKVLMTPPRDKERGPVWSLKTLSLKQVISQPSADVQYYYKVWNEKMLKKGD